MNNRHSLYFITSLLFFGGSSGGVHGIPLNPCIVPQSCSDVGQPQRNGTLPACRCDERCHLYNDCCYDAPKLSNEMRNNEGYGKIDCELFPVVDKKHHVFVVDSCPEFYPDENITVMCNYSTIRTGPRASHDWFPGMLSVEYVLKRLPVSSTTTGILYRNAFCAICNEEFNFEFWKIRVESNEPLKKNYSDVSSIDILSVINSSIVSYGPPSDDLAPRSCSKYHVADCPTNWTRNVTEDAAYVRSECQRYQSYVQVSPALYRNSHCARCNLVSETNMTCTDLMELIVMSVNWPDPLPYSVLLDFNSGFWEMWTLRNSPNDGSIDDDCQESTNETTANETGCGPCDSSQYPCARDSTYFPRNSVKTTGDLVLGYLTFVGNILSVISLSFLLLAYSCIPSLRNTPGRCLMCLCVSLMISQLLFAAFGNYDNQIPSFDVTPTDESKNETMTNEIDQLQNETKFISLYQTREDIETTTGDSGWNNNDNESVWVKPTTQVDEMGPSATMKVRDTVSNDQRGVAATTVSYSDSRVFVRREVPSEASTEPMSNEFINRTMATPSSSINPNPAAVRWTFRKDAKSIVCYASSLISHYFYLSYFCWSNTMAVDVWRTFRTLSSSLPSQADLRRRHFIYYSVYSWSVPAAIVTVAVVMDAVETSVRPLYAVRFCWISNPFGLLVFVYAPCLIVTVANIILFILSSVNICFSSMDDVQSRFGGRGLEGRRRLFLYVRLASVMGITWASGLLASVTKSTVLWYVFVVTTAFQGVYIGLCFMATNQMQKVIREKIKLNYTSSVLTKSTYK